MPRSTLPTVGRPSSGSSWPWHRAPRLGCRLQGGWLQWWDPRLPGLEPGVLEDLVVCQKERGRRRNLNEAMVHQAGWGAQRRERAAPGGTRVEGGEHPWPLSFPISESRLLLSWILMQLAFSFISSSSMLPS